MKYGCLYIQHAIYMQIDQQVAALIGKALSNEASADDMARLQEFFSQHPEQLQQYEVLKKLWPLHAGNSLQQSIDAEQKGNERLARIKEKATAARQQMEQTEPVTIEPIPIRKRARIYKQVFSYAAAILVVAGLFYILSLSNNTPTKKGEKKLVEITAENGSRKRIILPDGTTVILNAGSKVQYCKVFEGKTRDVRLYGEAFFDVVHNAKIPFHVHCNNIDIKVLGTAFNVKSYPDDSTTETTLIRGLVEIHDNTTQNAKPIYLHPSEKVTLARNTNTDVQIKAVVAATNQHAAVIHLDTIAKEANWVETAWIYNRLQFRKNTLEELARKMERWYAVSITVNDSALARQTFNGSFENETLEQALQALQKVTPFQFSIQNNVVVINAPK